MTDQDALPVDVGQAGDGPFWKHEIGSLDQDNQVLLEQPFVKDDSITVAELLEKVGKDTGGALRVKRFARIQIG